MILNEKIFARLHPPGRGFGSGSGSTGGRFVYFKKLDNSMENLNTSSASGAIGWSTNARVEVSSLLATNNCTSACDLIAFWVLWTTLSRQAREACC